MKKVIVNILLFRFKYIKDKLFSLSISPLGWLEQYELRGSSPVLKETWDGIQQAYTHN